MSGPERVVATPPSGPLVGERSADGVLRFRGVRFGTAGRFERPEPVPPHSGEVDAVAAGPVCPQFGSRLDAAMGRQWGEPPQSEDCLFLAVSTPALAGSRPVMVWLHGGGFLSGAGTLPWYDGGRLAADGDVVVVSVNYRLGCFGYLVHEGVSAGNLGLEDQLLALRWVRENIASFGGDPDNITLFGQSAGALSTVALLSAPEARGLVRRGIVQSSPTLELFMSVPDAQEVGAYFVEALGRDPRTASVEELLAAQRATLGWYAGLNPGTAAPPFGVVLDAPIAGVAENQRVLTADPMPELIVGWTSVECRAFAVAAQDEAVRAQFEEMSDWLIIEPSRQLARDYAAAGGRVHVYEIAWEPADGFGAIHCVELPLLLGTPESWAGSPMLGSTDWAGVDAVGAPLRAAFARFAHTGDPGDDWPAWTPGHEPVHVVPSGKESA